MGKMGIVLAVAAVLVLSGCSAAVVEQVAESAPSEVTATAEARAESTSEATADVTAPGAVCDPQSGNDFPCLVAYPDIAVTNMTAAPRSRDPLSQLAATDRIALAHEACDTLATGGTHESDILVETVPGDLGESPTLNNFNVFSAGAAAYCPEYADQWVQDALADAAS